MVTYCMIMVFAHTSDDDDVVLVCQKLTMRALCSGWADGGYKPLREKTEDVQCSVMHATPQCV